MTKWLSLLVLVLAASTGALSAPAAENLIGSTTPSLEQATHSETNTARMLRVNTVPTETGREERGLPEIAVMIRDGILRLKSKLTSSELLIDIIKKIVTSQPVIKLKDWINSTRTKIDAFIARVLAMIDIYRHNKKVAAARKVLQDCPYEKLHSLGITPEILFEALNLDPRLERRQDLDQYRYFDENLDVFMSFREFVKSAETRPKKPRWERWKTRLRNSL